MTSVATANATPHAAAGPERTTPTRSGYLDLRFPLPDKRYVGCLACQRDPLLSSLAATVLRSTKVVKAAPVPPSKGKKAKKEVEPAQEDLWEIELNDTVLFPEGGGQNSDTGSLVPLDAHGTPLEPEAGIVREVVRRNLDAVHLVTKPFPVGIRVLARVDLARRTDLMSMHTAQHLLSAVFERDHGLDTISWSLQKFPEPCYIELGRVPTRQEIEQVQARCNQAIQDRTEVTVRMELVSHETGVALNDKAPQDYRDEEGERAPVQRTVIIDDLDENPCCGTHYPDLSWLRSLFISPFTTPIRGTNCRLYFVAGPRVVEQLATSHHVARTSAFEAGCNPSDLADRIHGMVSSLADLKRREKRIKDELARYVANELWNKATTKTRTTIGSDDDDFVVSGLSFREDEATNSLEFLSLVSIELSNRIESQLVAVASDAAAATATASTDDAPKQRRRPKSLFILACGDTPGSTDPTNGAVLILGSDDELISRAGKLMVEAFAGKIKGGGKGRWQGKLTDKWVVGDREKLERVLELALVVA